MLSRLIRSFSQAYVAVLGSRPLARRRTAAPTSGADPDAPERVSVEIYPFF